LVKNNVQSWGAVALGEVYMALPGDPMPPVIVCGINGITRGWVDNQARANRSEFISESCNAAFPHYTTESNGTQKCKSERTTDQDMLHYCNTPSKQYCDQDTQNCVVN